MARIRRTIDLRFILNFYDALLRTPDLNKVSEALDIPASNGTLCAMVKGSPELTMAKELADERRGNNHSLEKYVLGKLSPEARKIWNDIEFWLDSGDVPDKVTERITESLRKELFVYALLRCSYNISRACRLVGINRATMASWTTADPYFRSLMNEVTLHKKDFFENALMDLVEERYPGAVLFVNRTINRDRGYDERFTVEHTGTVTAGLDLDSLDLDLDTRLKILEAIRRKKEKPVTNGEVTDVEAHLLPETVEAN